jgi:MoxR-like ATPase
MVDAIEVAPSIKDYIVRIAAVTRDHPDLRLGVSTRGSIAVLRAARAWAATADRDYVTPDDVQDVASAVCSHRVALSPEAELRGVSATAIVSAVLDEVEVPRRRDA